MNNNNFEHSENLLEQDNSENIDSMLIQMEQNKSK